MVQRVIDFSDLPSASGEMDLGLGLQIILEGDILIISDRQADLPTDQWPQITAQFSLPIPGKMELGNGWFLQAEIAEDQQSAKDAALKNRNPYRAWIDLGKRQPLLMVRSRHPGERIQPLGMVGKSMKISDFMINRKIPQRARSSWPLICAGDQIVWIPGYCLAHQFRIREKPQQIVILSLQAG